MKTNQINVEGFESAQEIMNNPVHDENIDKYALELYPTNEIKNIKPLPNQFIYIVSVIENKVIYHSKNIRQITGYNSEEFNIELILHNIHPDDKEIVVKGIRIAYLYGQNPVKGSIHNFFKINYRFRKKNGDYIKVQRYTFLVNEDKSGHMAHYKSICTDITDLKNDNKVDVKIYQDDKIVFSASTVELNNRFNKLSSREKEVCDLLCKGNSSIEISKKIFISKHTVDTHRRKIIKKLGLKNTNELLYGNF